MKQFVKGASLAYCGGVTYVPLRLRSTAAERFRQRQLAAWREVTGKGAPSVVPIEVNGREFATEAEARQYVKEAA